VWYVNGADYIVWRRFVEAAGDEAMRVRLDAMHAAVRSRCRPTIELPGGSRSCAPLLMIAEAAVAANQGKSEAAWRESWILALLRLAARRRDDATATHIAALLAAMDEVITDMKFARVWPWLGRPRKRKKRRAPGSARGRRERNQPGDRRTILVDPDGAIRPSTLP
jgi:hypothetical protein